MFRRRLIAFIVIFLCALGVLAGRLYYLQVTRHDYYQQLVQDKLTQPPRHIETLRGKIYDYTGRILAQDKPRFDVCLQYKLARLYDERFWQYRQIELFKDQFAGTADSSPEAFLQLQRSRGARQIESLLGQLTELPTWPANADRDDTPAPVAAILTELARLIELPESAIFTAARQSDIGPLAKLCSVSKKAIRDAVQRAKTDTLLQQVTQLCDLTRGDISRTIQALNDDFYHKQLARARRKWYTSHQIKFLPMPDQDSRARDFSQKLPRQTDRIYAIYQLDDLAEMRQGQVIVPDISEDTALIIGERIVGAFLGESGQDRPVHVRATKTRIYPHRDVACHLIGQLGPLASDEPLVDADAQPPTPATLRGYRYGDRRGHWGIECAFEPRLRGARGWASYSRLDPDNPLHRIAPAPGQDVTLTIDIELQRAIQLLFEQRDCRGAAVVIDVPTGQIRAAVSVPTFDLNTFYQQQQYQMIVLDFPKIYWRNRALSQPYQPGSTVKPTILLGALTTGRITPQTEHDCNVNNVDWRSGPKRANIHNHGLITADRAVTVSCNYYFARVGEAMGPTRTLAWLTEAGFGNRVLAWPAGVTDDLAVRAFTETTGTIHHQKRPLPTLGEVRFLSAGLAPFGASVLQMANAVATIARDGVFRQPTLIADPPVPPRQRPLVNSPEHVQFVQRAMSQVIYDRGGTGYDAFHPLPWLRDQVRLLGKTGTTKNSLFVAGAQAADGRALALAVVMEVPTYGSEDAARMAAAILTLCGNDRFAYLPRPAP